MTVLQVQESIREVAERLAEDNIQTSPELKAIYLFPAGDVVQLVMIDPVTLPSEQMVPYYFGAFPQGGVPYPSAIVLIRPEEQSVLSPPPGWGSWADAVQLWPKLFPGMNSGAEKCDCPPSRTENKASRSSVREGGQSLC